MTDCSPIGHLDCAHILFVPLHQRPSNICCSLLRRQVTCLAGLIELVYDAKANPLLSGLAESSFYPGMQYVIGSWYRKDELAKRSCIFHVSSAIATMCSGYLMAAVYHLGGKGGFAGWQWSVFFSEQQISKAE